MKKSNSKTSFSLKEITFIVDQTQFERDRGLYYIRSIDVDSPHHYLGTSSEVAEMFSKWLCNTLNAMKKNDCSTIEIKAKWR